jgi:hypothetical protein
MEATKKAFVQNIQKDRIKEGVDGLEERPNQIALLGATSLGKTLQEMIINFIRSVAGGTAVVVAGIVSV